jgi:uncharacterized protein (TIGR00255 family)
MKSMTGYGRGESASDGLKITVEIGSVNRKQSEVILSVPREFEPLEARLRDLINRRIARGRLTVRVALHATGERWAARPRVNRAAAKAYAHELARLGRELKLPGALSLEGLLALPGVVERDEAAETADSFWPGLEAAVEKALRRLVQMREREGAHLAQDLRQRADTLRRQVAKVKKVAPQVARRYRQQLLERVHKAGLEGIDPNDERLLKEVVLFADRSDVSEELTRLASHFQQLDDCLRSDEPVGRTLDFLAQELNREVNTIGAKANDSQISRAVVVLKAELEKFREQVQNVE